MKTRTIIPGEIPTRDFHQFLLGCVAPRPIAFVSTMDESGRPNLAPYSFFNAFSSNPPILVFSSNRRVADNTTKDTLHNMRVTGECVINSVSYNIVRQMAVSSVEFPTGVSEFEKSGLTPINSDLIKPYRVKESPSQMECKVKEIVTLGEHGGAGHLIICDVLRIHIHKSVIDERGRIDPHRMDLMGRLGRSYYARASGSAIHSIVQAVTKIPIGYDALPEHIRTSTVLTANQIGALVGLEQMPAETMIEDLKNEKGVAECLRSAQPHVALGQLASEWIDGGKPERALALLMLRVSGRE